MITRLGRALVAAFVLAAALGAGELVVPRNVFACYCAIPDSVAAFVGKPDVVIVAGRLTAEATFRIERIYKGPIALGDNRIVVDPSSCGFPMNVGERWILAARVVNNSLRPDICMQHARVGAPGGDALLEDIAAVYGSQPLLAEAPTAAPIDVTMAPPESDQPVEASLPSGFDPVQLGILIVTPFVAIVFILAVVTAFRRREDGSEAP